MVCFFRLAQFSPQTRSSALWSFNMQSDNTRRSSCNMIHRLQLHCHATQGMESEQSNPRPSTIITVFYTTTTQWVGILPPSFLFCWCMPFGHVVTSYDGVGAVVVERRGETEWNCCCCWWWSFSWKLNSVAVSLRWSLASVGSVCRLSLLSGIMSVVAVPLITKSGREWFLKDIQLMVPEYNLSISLSICPGSSVLKRSSFIVMSNRVRLAE